MFIIDLHTHTISSGHAYSSLQENVKGALDNGIHYLGMSDHAPTMPGAPHAFHFMNLKVIPEYINTVKILKGIEANIINYNGDIDVNNSISKHLDYVIASLHIPTIEPGNIEENTNAILKAMENPIVTIIGHPDDGRYPIDYEKIVLKAKETKTLIEINNSSLNPNGTRMNTESNSEVILNLCKKHEVCVILGSDAHISYDVGKFDNAIKLIKKVNFPRNLIVNNDYENLSEYLKKSED